MLLNNQRIRILVCLILVTFLAASTSMAQGDQDEALKKKYEAILGEYEFDLSEFGGDVILLKFEIKDGALWGDSGDGMPVTLEQVADDVFEFTAEDPESGSLEFRFPKDDKGEYTICQVAILDQGVELTGIKIEK